MSRSEKVTIGDWWSETASRLRAAAEASRSRSSDAPGWLGVLVVSGDGTVETCCHNLERMLRCAESEIRGAAIGSILPGVDSLDTLRQHAARFRALAAEAPRVLELSARRPDGSLFPVAIADPDLGSPWQALSQLLIYDLSRSHAAREQDESHRLQAEERLFPAANYDAVTRLPNRDLLVDRLGNAVALCRRNGRSIAVLHLDLDRFRRVNDTLGYPGGDELLSLVGERLRSCVRQADTVARVGGDEFVILLVDLRDEEDGQQVLGKVMDRLSLPFLVHERDIYLSASMGVSLFPRDGVDAQRLLKYADLAMYQAKVAGRNRYVFFDRSMHKAASDSTAMATRLRAALENEELALYYQPQIDIGSGCVTVVEALLRWHHPDGGVIGPDRFVPLLGDLGMIGGVTEWVIETACTQIRALADVAPHIGVAVNLSTRQFSDPRLPHLVDAVLAKTLLDPRLLELEITEGTLMEDVPMTSATLNALAGRGIRIVIDDFGTGYSSLTHLKRFAVDTIKIDRSVASDATCNRDAATIVKAVVSLGRELDVSVVAEGVETAEQLEFLRSLQCTRAQGHFFSRPLPPAALREFLVRWPGASAG